MRFRRKDLFRLENGRLYPVLLTREGSMSKTPDAEGEPPFDCELHSWRAPRWPGQPRTPAGLRPPRCPECIRDERERKRQEEYDRTRPVELPNPIYGATYPKLEEGFAAWQTKQHEAGILVAGSFAEEQVIRDMDEARE